MQAGNFVSTTGRGALGVLLVVALHGWKGYSGFRTVDTKNRRKRVGWRGWGMGSPQAGFLSTGTKRELAPASGRDGGGQCTPPPPSTWKAGTFIIPLGVPKSWSCYIVMFCIDEYVTTPHHVGHDLFIHRPWCIQAESIFTLVGFIYPGSVQSNGVTKLKSQ